MNLMQWRSRSTNPFNSLFGLQHEINRMFEELTHPGHRGEDGESAITPALDIKEDDKYLTVSADLPGVDSKDVEIAVHDNVLTIKGEKRSERHEKKDSYRCVERMFGSFERRVTLPSEVDSERAEASMENGVLTLRLPKMEAAGAKTIPIRSGGSRSELGSASMFGGSSSGSQGQQYGSNGSDGQEQSGSETSGLYGYESPGQQLGYEMTGERAASGEPAASESSYSPAGEMSGQAAGARKSSESSIAERAEPTSEMSGQRSGSESSETTSTSKRSGTEKSSHRHR